MRELIELLRDPGIQKLLFVLVGAMIAFLGSIGLESYRARSHRKLLRLALASDLEELLELLRGLEKSTPSVSTRKEIEQLATQTPVGTLAVEIQLNRILSLYGGDLESLKVSNKAKVLKSLCRLYGEARGILMSIEYAREHAGHIQASPRRLIEIVEDALRGLR